jgi:thiamine biosynthesis lipoprotein
LDRPDEHRELYGGLGHAGTGAEACPERHPSERFRAGADSDANAIAITKSGFWQRRERATDIRQCAARQSTGQHNRSNANAGVSDGRLLMQVLEFRAMNTSVLLAAESTDRAADGLERTRAFVLEMEARFSRFVPDSELSRLNRSAGKWATVSPELLELLSVSRECYKATRGLFDPSILPDLVRAGYDRSMEAIRATAGMANSLAAIEPVAMVPAPARANGNTRPRFSEVEFDTSRDRVMLPHGLAIDLGGIAKGWIVERAAAMLAAYARPAAVNAGGDIFFEGKAGDGSKWQVELEDPRNPSATLTTLYVAGGAVVTSSRTKRTWSRDGEIRHHIIDPRTADPAITSWLSVSTIASSATVAEAYAKALLIGGPREARRLGIGDGELAYLAVDSEGRLSGSRNIGLYLNGDVIPNDYSEN